MIRVEWEIITTLIGAPAIYNQIGIDYSSHYPVQEVSGDLSDSKSTAKPLQSLIKELLVPKKSN